MQGHFPEPVSAAVAGAAVGGDEQLAGIAVALRAHLAPPSANGFGGKAGGVMIDAHAHPTLILTYIEYAIGNSLAQCRAMKTWT